MGKIIKINNGTEHKKIKYAADIIKSGGIVVFPTETVYGIGCDIKNVSAIKKIYKIKKRSENTPFTVHISDIESLYTLAKEISPIAKKLIKKYWPGPLTIVFKKNKNVNGILTAGKNTVGIRMPDNEITLNLIKQANTPIVGTSANISGTKEPQTVKDVLDGIRCKEIDLIIDSGKVKFGIPSTVIDLTEKQIKILRKGVLEKELLKRLKSGKLRPDPLFY